jgi:signal transduction histidine kinase
LSDVRMHGGLGLISMQERARLVGGNLLLRTRPGAGTLILVRVPTGREKDRCDTSVYSCERM